MTLPIRGKYGLLLATIMAGLFTCLFLGGCGSGTGTHSLNRLKDAASPYLQEHADNPVDWYEWGEEALEKAKQENKPLLISIGYASCHWCHVMERESFMDTAVARLMNESFICIKVDREERPDIDDLYMRACRLLNNGEAGWPLQAFALPDGSPFFAGTYYSNESWKNLLGQISNAYRNQYKKVELQAQSIRFGMIDNNQFLLSTDSLNSGPNGIVQANLFEAMLKAVDSTHGGLKGREKFPTPSVWEYMLQQHYYSGNEQALRVSLQTLDRMALGGLYDKLSGGFARYSADSIWKVPHFEKMLYDNALLISLYAHAYQLTGDEFYKSVMENSIAFVEKELAAERGGYYSSLNAETSEGEGYYHTWSYAELRSVLSKAELELLRDYYQITEQGNWQDGRNILFSHIRPDAYAQAMGIDVGKVNSMLATIRTTLLSLQAKREKPSVDRKIITSWNAMMLHALLDAYAATGQKEYWQRANQLAKFLEEDRMEANGQVFRLRQADSRSTRGFLDDYAWLGKAYSRLYQFSFDKRWLNKARTITDYVLNNFSDSSNALFYFDKEKDAVNLINQYVVEDNITPSANALMAELLADMGLLYDQQAYLQRSERMLNAMQAKMMQAPAYYAHWCALYGREVFGRKEVAIIGAEAVSKNYFLQKNYSPGSLFLGSDRAEDLPLLDGKYVAGKTMIYVCSNKVCRRPVEDAELALAELNRTRQ
jgi:uncharacterized protein YyaL (SSP411 family)